MTAPTTTIPDRFNAARFFVDRHVEDGQGARSRSSTRRASSPTVTCRRWSTAPGNALRDLGVEPEQRVLALLLDSPEFLATFWGAIKIGAIPVPVNTLLRPARLPRLPERQPGEGPWSCRRPCCPRSKPVLAQAQHLRHVVVAGRALRPPPRLRRLERAGLGEPDRGGHVAGRRRLLAVFVGVDRVSQGRRPPPARLGRLRRRLRPRRARDDRADCTVSAAKLFFAYGLGNTCTSHARGRERVLVSPPAHARGDVRADPPPPAHALLRRPHAVRRHAPGEGGRAALRSLVAPAVRLGGRGPARGPVWALARAVRGGGAGRHRVHGDPPHLPVESPGPGPAGIDRPGRPRLRGGGGGRRLAARCRRRDRQSLRQGDSTMAYYWNQHEKTKAPSSATGSAPGTSTTGTPTGTSGTAGAPTTC